MLASEVFFTKGIKPLDSDEHLRFIIIRAFFGLSLLSIIVRFSIWVMGQSISAKESAMFMLPLTFFLTMLFLHINNKAENPSLIVLGLTWLSLQ